MAIVGHRENRFVVVAGGSDFSYAAHDGCNRPRVVQRNGSPIVAHEGSGMSSLSIALVMTGQDGYARRMIRRLVVGMVALSTLAACSVEQPRSPRIMDAQSDAQPQIDDDDIRKAFEARPQMPVSNIRLSYYTFDTDIAADLDKTFATMPGVSSVYRIPPLLVNGERRVQNQGGYAPRTGEVSIKKLRLLAARAKTDVLVLVDHGIHNEGVNPLIGFTALIVPIFFLPFVDTYVKGYVETFVFDVRNGYLYGHLVQEDERGEKYTTIYGKKLKAYTAEQWKVLQERFRVDLAALMEKERTRKDSTP